MLRAENITYSVGSKRLLEQVSITFFPGKLNLIIGPNGAGKSTLIKILSNQLKAENGAVFYDKENIRQKSVAELACIRSVLSQNIELAFPLRVQEVVMMGRYPHFSGDASEKDYAACEEAMIFFDVKRLADQNYMTLSGGEKQRTQFARVAAQIWYPIKGKFRYLLLDEPLTSLDIHYQFDFMQKSLELLKAKDLVIVAVVHDLNLAAKFADYLVLMNQGRIMSSGGKEDVLSKENIKAAYGMEPIIRKEGNQFYLLF
ncbi:MAG: heme ABC transporter ATP-binding protein [Bacteroidetes bacterium]|nr:heme ABC transporter ATP-binding protein [Bacteroidota bacterium]